MTGARDTDATTIVWLRRDLRLAANPALAAALALAREQGGRLLPVSVWEPPGRRAWAPGAAGRWWQSHSLAALAGDLAGRGSRLAVLTGEPARALAAAARAARADTVVWAAGTDPGERTDDADVRTALAAAGVRSLVVEPAGLLLDPAGPLTREGRPYTVFTPYWRACLSWLAGSPPQAATPAPEALPAAPEDPAGISLESLRTEAVRPWSAGFAGAWHPGEAGAAGALSRFLDETVADYAGRRDRPALPGTSRLSPHLHWGELTAAQVWRAVHDALTEAGEPLEVAVAPAGRDESAGSTRSRSAGVYLRQLGWREFAHHLLWHFSDTPEHPLRAASGRFPWRDDPAGLEAWQRGRTGYPLVDAAMRELWTTGWMHNRARLVAASFLVKHLLLPWRLGEDWFWDTLVDADLANNALGWQWVAGSGADAAPYFRIFNPVTQGERYDPGGDYVRRWVPELSELPAGHIHAPWTAPPLVLAGAGVVLGETYPLPIVDHAAARMRALAAYDVVKRAGAGAG